ncbi:MAG: hypothetical protein FD156_1514 [Nitrospirae bacterium]|nr:MAG: hypothetical protein FD156_1514 [Nitrospirota bacterium]
MNKRKIVQLFLFIAMLLSVLFYLSDTYPLTIKNISKKMSLASLLIVYIGLLSTYFAFFIWPNMSLGIYMSLAFLLIIFFNLFLLSIYSSYAPLGIIVILIFLVGLLLTRENARKKRRDTESV